MLRSAKSSHLEQPTPQLMFLWTNLAVGANLLISVPSHWSHKTIILFLLYLSQACPYIK